ncbi:DsbA family protein [Halomonas organivorans]
MDTLQKQSCDAAFSHCETLDGNAFIDGQDCCGKVRLRVWLDFVCPYCLLSEASIYEAAKSLDVKIEWMPFELRPYPELTLRPEGKYLQTVWASSVYPMAKRLGVPIQLPKISPQPYTRLAFEGMQYAKSLGKADAYIRGVLNAFFVVGEDIGKLDVLEKVAYQSGLDRMEFRSNLESGRFFELHQAMLDVARQHDIRAVPTIQIGTVRIEGVPDLQELRECLQRQLECGGARTE